MIEEQKRFKRRGMMLKRKEKEKKKKEKEKRNRKKGTSFWRLLLLLLLLSSQWLYESFIFFLLHTAGSWFPPSFFSSLSSFFFLFSFACFRNTNTRWRWRAPAALAPSPGSLPSSRVLSFPKSHLTSPFSTFSFLFLFPFFLSIFRLQVWRTSMLILRARRWLLRPTCPRRRSSRPFQRPERQHSSSASSKSHSFIPSFFSFFSFPLPSFFSSFSSFCQCLLPIHSVSICDGIAALVEKNRRKKEKEREKGSKQRFLGWYHNDLSADEGMQYCTMRNNFPPFDGGRGIYSVFRRLLDLGEWTKDQKERV